MKTKLACGANLIIGICINDAVVDARRTHREAQEASLWALAQKGQLDIDEVIDLVQTSRKAGPFLGAAMRQESIDRYKAVA
jgi:hypothetical protein